MVPKNFTYLSNLSCLDLIIGGVYEKCKAEGRICSGIIEIEMGPFQENFCGL